jgi:hypothetical protein
MGGLGQQRVRLHPGLVTAAIQRGVATPLALWLLARCLDRDGVGRVPLDELKREALLIWSRSKVYGAIRDGERLGLVKRVTRLRDGQNLLEVRSVLKVARLFGINDLGRSVVLVRPSALRTAATLKAVMFCAFQAARSGSTGQPISRETLCELTGVPRRTQPVYEQRNNARRDGQVQPQRNFAVIGLSPEALRGAREHVHGGCFLWGAAVVCPLPNAYSTSLSLGSGSRLRKVNRALKCGLLGNGGGHRMDRVFFSDAKAARRTAQREARQEQGTPTALRPAIGRRFYRDGQTNGGAGIWRAC